MAVASSPSPHTGATPLTGIQVIGGRQRAPQGMRELDERWYGYGRGVVVDVTAGAARTIVEYESAPGTCGPEDPVLYKSASRVGDRLYACTQTEVLVYDYPSFDLLHHVSHPVLNDVHHVIPSATGTLLVAVSGHDAVAELDVDGELLNLWSVADGVDRVPIDPDVDYRIDCDLKPHAVHPNYLFRLGEEVWATRFETRDAVAVHNPSRRIAIDRERCHDGVVHDGAIYFTTVDGCVVEVDADSLHIRAVHELQGRRTNTVLGWCRGLTFRGDHAFVGFSRIRHTKFRNTLSWMRKGLTGSEPTRVAVYDRRTWTLIDEIDLEDAGCNAVFTIVDAGADS
ncbi:MAG: hypothetical protein AAF467_13430 [Actinomycetota bacterium]